MPLNPVSAALTGATEGLQSQDLLCNQKTELSIIHQPCIFNGPLFAKRKLPSHQHHKGAAHRLPEHSSRSALSVQASSTADPEFIGSEMLCFCAQEMLMAGGEHVKEAK